VRRADERARRVLGREEHTLGVRERRGHRLLDEHVLARLERGDGQPRVLGHAREHEHGVDLGVRRDGDVVRHVGRQAEALGGRAPLALVGVVDRRDLDASLTAEALDERHVGRPEDAAAADDAETDAHVALRAVA
jgi:hypothetical protein